MGKKAKLKAEEPKVKFDKRENNVDIDDFSSADLTSDTDTSIVNEWDMENISTIKKIGDLCGAYNWIHNQTAKRYILINYVLHVLVLVVTGYVIGSPIASLSDDSNAEWPKILLVVAGVSIASIKSVHVFLKLPDKISDQRSAATKYSAIFNKIAKVMRKGSGDRPNANTFIDEILDEYNESYKESPIVWGCMLKKYIKLIPDDSGINYKDLIGIKTIQVRKGSHKKKRSLKNSKISKLQNVHRISKNRRAYELDRYFIHEV